MRLLEAAILIQFATTGSAAVTLEGPREHAQAIRALDSAWSEALQCKDLDSVMSNYASDAVLLPPDEPMVRGSDAIRKWFHRRLATPGYSATFTPVHIVVAASADLAYEIGTFRVVIAGENQSTQVYVGKHLVTWIRPNGHWRVAAESINRDGARSQN